jgi:hypothetical protein
MTGKGSVGDFAHIRPNRTVVCALDGSNRHVIAVPEEFSAANVMVEASTGALRTAQVGEWE